MQNQFEVFSMHLVFFWNPLLYWISMLFAKSCIVLAL
jgi:hypothetical protein